MTSKQVVKNGETGIINNWFCLFIVITAIVICFLPKEVSVSVYSIVILSWMVKFIVNPYWSLIMAKEEEVPMNPIAEALNIIHDLLCIAGMLFLITYTRRIYLCDGELALVVFCVQFGLIAMILFYFTHGKYQEKINWIGYTIGLIGFSLFCYLVVVSGNTIGSKKVITEKVIIENMNTHVSTSNSENKTVIHYIHVQYENGEIEKMPVNPLHYYFRFKEGDSLNITEYKGSLGMPWKTYDSRFEK